MDRMSWRNRLLVALFVAGLWLLVLALVGIGALIGGWEGGERQWQIFGGCLGMGVAVLVVAKFFLRESWIETGCLLVLMGCCVQPVFWLLGSEGC